jgi:glutaryl-CoA dehydrogenase (non-decarboxylating)
MHGKLGLGAADTGEIVYDNLRIPLDAMVGAEGEGFKYAMATFDHSRPEIGAIADRRVTAGARRMSQILAPTQRLRPAHREL